MTNEKISKHDWLGIFRNQCEPPTDITEEEAKRLSYDCDRKKLIEAIRGFANVNEETKTVTMTQKFFVRCSTKIRLVQMLCLFHHYTIEIL